MKKKEYVKPQNRVVILKDSLLQTIGESEFGGNEAKKKDFDDSEDSYSSDVWED